MVYPAVLWGALACLRTLHPPLYTRAARLCAVMSLAWPFDDPTGAGVDLLRAAAPVPIGRTVQVDPGVLALGCSD